MAIDVKQPKGYRKAWNGSFRPLTSKPEPLQLCDGCGAALATCVYWKMHGKVACCPDCKHPPATVAWAVSNCHTLARRARARSTSVYDREKWEHVLRICEKAGARSAGVLRASLPTELTEGALGTPPMVPHALRQLREELVGMQEFAGKDERPPVSPTWTRWIAMIDKALEPPTVPASPPQELQFALWQLIRKWRQNPEPACADGDRSANDRDVPCDGILECADELEAALAASSAGSREQA